MTDIPFVQTSIAERITALVTRAMSRFECAVIVGETGLGKTCTFRHLSQTTEGIYLLECSASRHQKLLDVMMEVAAFFMPYIKAPRYDVIRELDRYTLTGSALIVDEAQSLKPQFLRELLTLNERTGLSVIFGGNYDVLKSSYAETGPLAQISDRIALWDQIDCLPDADADALATSFGVQGDDARRLVRKIGARFRARALVRVLEEALVKADSKAIKAEHIRQALTVHNQYRAVLK